MLKNANSMTRIKNYTGYNKHYNSSRFDKFNYELAEMGQSKTLIEEVYGTVARPEESMLEKARIIKNRSIMASNIEI